MTETIYKFVRELFIVGVLGELSGALIQNDKYKKYANYISGLALILICVKMSASLIGINWQENMSEAFDAHITGGEAQIAELLCIDENDSIYVKEYIRANEEYIKKFASEFGFDNVNISIEMAGALIARIEVVAEASADYEKMMELKKGLADIYDIDSSNIYVYGRS